MSIIMLVFGSLVCQMFMYRFCEYFEILLDSLVCDTGLCLCLSHHVVKIFLKVLSVFDQMHRHIVVGGTRPQTRKDGPERGILFYYFIIYVHVVLMHSNEIYIPYVQVQCLRSVHVCITSHAETQSP